MVGIYKITSPSGGVYIGQSWNIEKRFRGYKYTNPSNSKQRVLAASFKKYGIENHLFQVIHELPSDIDQFILDAYEILYWENYKVCEKMLNCKDPGSRGKHHQKAKQLISESGKKRWADSNFKDKIVERLAGKGWRRSRYKKKPVIEGKKTNKRMIPVVQFTISGMYITSYESITSAAKKTRIHMSSIGGCARGHHETAGGFIWKYKDKFGDLSNFPYFCLNRSKLSQMYRNIDIMNGVGANEKSAPGSSII